MRSRLIVNPPFFFLIFSAVIETSCHLLMGKLSNIMGNNVIDNKENEAEKAYITATKTIDGRLFSIRAFFPEGSAETMQEKIERMLHNDIVKTIRRTAA